MIRFGSTTTCWEFKCYTPFLPSGAKGNGSARCGGAASRADGHFIALGNTEEHLSVVVLGHPQRGDPDTEEQLWTVSAATDGWQRRTAIHYADALAKGHTVILLVTESTGVFSADLDRVLRQLARTARASGSPLTTHAVWHLLRVHPLALHLPLRGVWSVACVNSSHRPGHLSLTR